MAFTFDANNSSPGKEQNNQSSPSSDPLKNRRKRSDRGRTTKGSSNKKSSNMKPEHPLIPLKDSEIKSVLTMDQFANFLLKKSSYIESKENSEVD